MTEDILIVDDEADIRTGIRNSRGRGLRGPGGGDSDETFAVVGSPAESYFARHLAPGQPSRRHADPGELKQEHPAVPVVIMSGHGTIETAVQAIKLGAYDFIEKPLRPTG